MTFSRILVIGGAGFIGSHVVARLAAQGRRVVVPTRRAVHGRPLTVLPTVDVVEADVHDPAALRRLVAGQDAVINLVGILHGDRGQPYGKAFMRAHVALPANLRAACVEAGVARVLQVSALGAARTAPSMYLRSKADGEAALDDPALAVTIFRPSVVFGPGDAFLNLFARLQKWFPVMPLGSADARFQPVYVGDVAQALVAAVDARETVGQVIELAGPRVYTLRELVRLAGQYAGHPRPIIGLPAALARLQAWLLELEPGPTLMSRDNVDSMRVPNVATGPLDPALAQVLGLTAPTLLEEVAPTYLAPAALIDHYDRYRRRR